MYSCVLRPGWRGFAWRSSTHFTTCLKIPPCFEAFVFLDFCRFGLGHVRFSHCIFSAMQLLATCPVKSLQHFNVQSTPPSPGLTAPCRARCPLHRATVPQARRMGYPPAASPLPACRPPSPVNGRGNCATLPAGWLLSPVYGREAGREGVPTIAETGEGKTGVTRCIGPPFRRRTACSAKPLLHSFLLAGKRKK